jgi:hypothetical protein
MKNPAFNPTVAWFLWSYPTSEYLYNSFGYSGKKTALMLLRTAYWRTVVRNLRAALNPTIAWFLWGIPTPEYTLKKIWSTSPGDVKIAIQQYEKRVQKILDEFPDERV